MIYKYAPSPVVYLLSSNVVKEVCAGGPDPKALLATTEQEQVSGENPATVKDPEWEKNWGREEGEGEQETVQPMFSLLCWDTDGGNQEKTTCFCPATASNISGAPIGTEDAMAIMRLAKYFYLTKQEHTSIQLEI